MHSRMPSPTAPCPTCAGSGRVVAHRNVGWSRSKEADACRDCGTRVEELAAVGAPAECIDISGCPGCSTYCTTCDGRGFALCSSCGETGAHRSDPRYLDRDDAATWLVCDECLPEGDADAHAERCSQLAAWCDGIESAPALTSHRTRRVAA